MKRQKWKAIVLCLGLIVFLVSFVISRQQSGPQAHPGSLFIPVITSNTVINPVPVRTDLPPSNRPLRTTAREEIVGVGLMLRMENGELLVAGLVPNSPATKAGLAE